MEVEPLITRDELEWFFKEYSEDLLDARERLNKEQRIDVIEKAIIDEADALRGANAVLDTALSMGFFAINRLT